MGTLSQQIVMAGVLMTSLMILMRMMRYEFQSTLFCQLHVYYKLKGFKRDINSEQEMTRDARDNITFFAFHTFLVEVHRMKHKSRLAKLYNCRACVCNSNVEIRVVGSSGSPAVKFRNTDLQTD